MVVIFHLEERGPVHHHCGLWYHHYQLQPAHPELTQRSLMKCHFRPYLCERLPDAGPGSQREWKIAVIWPAKKKMFKTVTSTAYKATSEYLTTAAKKWSKYQLT